MWLYDEWNAILKIRKFRRIISYADFYCFVSALSYWYTNNTTRDGTSRGAQFYASYPAGTELLTDTAKLYKTALGNCFEIDERGPIEYSIMAKHFERQGKPPYAYHSVENTIEQAEEVGSGVLGFTQRVLEVVIDTLKPGVDVVLPLLQKPGDQALKIATPAFSEASKKAQEAFRA